MTDQRNGYYRQDAGVRDIMGSVFNLASAGTRFTIGQMQNAISVFTDPSGTMNRVKSSLDNLSAALTKPCEAPAAAPSEPLMASDELNGRKS